MYLGSVEWPMCSVGAVMYVNVIDQEEQYKSSHVSGAWHAGGME